MNIYELLLLNFSYISVLTWKLLPSESILIIQIATKKPDIDLKNTLTTISLWISVLNPDWKTLSRKSSVTGHFSRRE